MQSENAAVYLITFTSLGGGKDSGSQEVMQEILIAVI